MYTAQDVAEIDKQYDFFRKAHKKHKKEFEDIFAILCEGMEKTKKESIAWREELGIDEVEEDPKYRWQEDPLAQLYKKAKTSSCVSSRDGDISINH
ncbi:protein of unknown function [Taphrina deformans PYCC 5710]|uniref:Uncharacterized protein n=1 Tax=Taphrina deformans (strain PYCC 5710 / ATCC 11124 / CBS 356.35 / IMI 108563 / JCM 9778 / NBRC 8474) TaxID=1097556 RepID=R4XDN9_TAPDE|nr:protein of unknown function [Taphrina deformans PYCC 5710]|eukprot:CCG83991.1 protein of unknown function [Taphrina deformans PYCC 5710]